MADYEVNLGCCPYRTISVPSGTSGQLNAVPGRTYEIVNVGESGNTVYFNMTGGTVQSTGTTGAFNQHVLGIGGTLDWLPDPAHPYIAFITQIGTSVLSVKWKGS